MQANQTKLNGLLRLARSFLGFVSVGAVNTVLSILLYEMLILFLPYWLAYLIPFPVSIAFLLYANANFVFGRAVTLRSAVAFTFFYIASCAAGFLVITVLVGLIGVPPAFAPIGVLAIMTPINFVGSRLALRLDTRLAASGGTRRGVRRADDPQDDDRRDDEHRIDRISDPSHRDTQIH